MIRPVETPGFPAPVSRPRDPRKTPTSLGVFLLSDRTTCGSKVRASHNARTRACQGVVWQRQPRSGDRGPLMEWQQMSSDRKLTHFDPSGASRMVDVGAKLPTHRFARASARVAMQAETLHRIRARGLSKGDVLEVARLAGIMAAKRTSDLIPLCHPLALESVEVRFDFPRSRSPPRRVSRWKPWLPSPPLR